jgi:hypothetical protein
LEEGKFNKCDDDFVLEMDDVYPSNIRKSHLTGRNFLEGTMVEFYQKPTKENPNPTPYTVSIDGMEQSMQIKDFQNTTVKIELDKIEILEAIIGQKDTYFKRESKDLVILVSAYLSL